MESANGALLAVLPAANPGLGQVDDREAEVLVPRVHRRRVGGVEHTCVREQVFNSNVHTPFSSEMLIFGQRDRQGASRVRFGQNVSQ